MEPAGGSARVEFVRPLVVYRNWIVLFAMFVAVFVLAGKMMSKTTYEASVVLVPTQTGGDVSDKLAQFSGLASLAGINLRGNNNVSSYERFMYLIFSAELANYQIKHENVLQMLYPERWDSEHKQWIPPRGMSVSLRDFLGGITGQPPSPWQPPDAWDVMDKYKANLIQHKMASLTDARETQMVQLTYTDTDPVRAQTLLRNVVTDANELLRQYAKARATNQAEYLRGQLNATTIEDYRDTLNKLLAEQEQTLMLTNSNLPFAAESMTTETVPVKKSGKRTILFVAIGAAVGFCFAYMIAIMAYNWRRDQYAEIDFSNKPVPVFATIRAWLSGLFRGRTVHET